MIPAQSRGAQAARFKFEGAQHESLIHHDAFGISAIGDASEMFVRRIKSQDHIRTELLEACLALCTRSIRIHHAADRSDVARLELCDSRAYLGHTTDDFVARHNWINGGHKLAPLISHGMNIGVADPAVENFDLHIVFFWIAPRDLSRSHC